MRRLVALLIEHARLKVDVKSKVCFWRPSFDIAKFKGPPGTRLLSVQFCSFSFSFLGNPWYSTSRHTCTKWGGYPWYLGFRQASRDPLWFITWGRCNPTRLCVKVKHMYPPWSSLSWGRKTVRESALLCNETTLMPAGERTRINLLSSLIWSVLIDVFGLGWDG